MSEEWAATLMMIAIAIMLVFMFTVCNSDEEDPAKREWYQLDHGETIHQEQLRLK